MSNLDDVLTTAAQNIASYSAMVITLRWGTMLPPPDRFVEWMIGILVGISITTFNVVRTVQALKSKKK